MKAKFKKLMKNQKGMTLIELLAVIVIIAIIALIAIPAIANVIQNSKDKAALSDASQVVSAAKIAISDGACGDADGTGAISCEKSELQPFVDGLTLADGDKVVKAKNGSYSLVFARLQDIDSSGKFKTAKPTNETTSIEYSVITGLMK
ncbi:prepilin-type N-terminal cleavage/methylation domain-containing protein [Rummeliibacillus suwonensis]|uniref:prepilin-type N-terminal cleavage/methylation domain-containing protein n=1 Tax=Rummeliibacillus suwonensis TaxID=1306154 RepID=UPI0011B643CC|nr:prepilin-type N-terminal cleavage/methylation domain-containing protein [Rummeliibacillus suwonensis]